MGIINLIGSGPKPVTGKRYRNHHWDFLLLSVRTSGDPGHAQLPNDQLEELELVEHLAVQVQYPDAGPLHARPGGQAEVQTVLEGALADREAAPQLGAGDGRETVPAVQHWVPAATSARDGLRRRRRHRHGTQAAPDLRAGQRGVTIPAVQRRGLPVELLLRDGRTPGARCGLVQRRAHRSFLRLWYAHADALRLGAWRRHARHPHLHLRALLAGSLRTHPCLAGGPRRRQQQARRRVTPTQSLVQGEPLLDIALLRVVVFFFGTPFASLSSGLRCLCYYDGDELVFEKERKRAHIWSVVEVSL